MDMYVLDNLIYVANAEEGVFIIRNNLIPAPPHQFSLYEPRDDDTLNTNDITFIWQESFDPNVEDTVVYKLNLRGNTQSYDTLVSRNQLTVLFESDSANWWVEAISGEDTVSSVVFTFFQDLNFVSDFNWSVGADIECLEVYPSPANNIVNLKYKTNNSSILTLSVFNLLGQIVYQHKSIKSNLHNNFVSLDVDSWPTGKYIARLTSRSWSKEVSFIVIK